MILTILFAVAIIIDGIIRRRFYAKRWSNNISTVIELYNRREKGLTVGMEEVFNNSIKSYGIMGVFEPRESFKEEEWLMAGDPLFVTDGVVVDKKKITAEDMIDRMSEMKRSGVSSLSLTMSGDMLEDKYYVTIAPKVGDGVFHYSDKVLYKNTDINDTVFLKILNNQVLSVTFRSKDARTSKTVNRTEQAEERSGYDA